MRKTLVKSVSPVGIHIGCEHIRAVQVASTPRRTFIAARAAMPRRSDGVIPSRDDIADIACAFERWGMSGRRVSLAMPRELLKVDMLELPPQSSGAPIETIAALEMARLHNLEPGTFETRCWTLPHSRASKDRSSAIAVSCKSEELATLLDNFESCGLDVVRVDTESWADARACATLASANDSINAIINIDWDIARLTIVHRSTVVYERAMPEKGLDRTARAIGERMGVDIATARHLILHTPDACSSPSERRVWNSEVLPMLASHFKMIASDIRSAFGYTAHQIAGADIGNVVMIGTGSACFGALEQMHELLDIDALQAGISDLFRTNAKKHTGHADEFVTSLGMALGTSMDALDVSLDKRISGAAA